MNCETLSEALSRRLFPPGVVLAVCREAEPGALPGPERELCKTMAAGPARLFAMGRMAARSTLETLGAAPRPLLRGGHGEPLWPEGYLGSISHTRGLGLAAAVQATVAKAIGIDVELSERRPNPDILKRIATSAEQNWIDRSGIDPSLGALQLLSAKEAVYKAFYPLTGVALNFMDVSLERKGDSYIAALTRNIGTNHPAGTSLDIQTLEWSGYHISAVCL